MLVKIPELGKRTECHNKPKPYLGYRPGHGMPSCSEPNHVYDEKDGKAKFDKGFKRYFGKPRSIKSYQKGRRTKYVWREGKLIEQSK